MRRILLLLLVFVAGPARAEKIGLVPASSRIELRAYGLGIMPLDGNFTRFHGWMTYDPSNPTACQVILQIEADSLAMEDGSIQGQITGPDFMDVARFPDLAFQGDCSGDGVTGSLSLHGETHPLTLDLDRTGREVVAVGHLRRAEWGITGHRLMGGSTIRIRVRIPNPVAHKAASLMPGRRGGMVEVMSNGSNF